MRWFDTLTEVSARSMAKRTSRRSVIASLGAVLVGASALPLLPVARGATPADQPGGGKTGVKPAPAPAGQTGTPQANSQPKADAVNDPTSCDYWRHCAIDGFLCGCCGGSQNTCPPGTEMSAVTWVGTCHNPGDGKDYVVSYNDCCGKSTCGRCLCNRNERDTPIYIPFQSNDYNWCSGSSKANIAYHCSTARIVSVAK
ncbi:MAG TPA: methylamine dehydrogenase light chain [Steroidobacteraceae bacterium]|nr:methylamine dehydrogenase light chain [Steroidobacteraceae bacterium]